MPKDKVKPNSEIIAHVLKQQGIIKSETDKNFDYSVNVFIAILVKEDLLDRYFSEEGRLLPGVL